MNQTDIGVDQVCAKLESLGVPAEMHGAVFAAIHAAGLTLVDRGSGARCSTIETVEARRRAVQGCPGLYLVEVGPVAFLEEHRGGRVTRLLASV